MHQFQYATASALIPNNAGPNSSWSSAAKSLRSCSCIESSCRSEDGCPPLPGEDMHQVINCWPTRRSSRTGSGQSAGSLRVPDGRTRRQEYVPRRANVGCPTSAPTMRTDSSRSAAEKSSTSPTTSAISSAEFDRNRISPTVCPSRSRETSSSGGSARGRVSQAESQALSDPRWTPLNKVLSEGTLRMHVAHCGRSCVSCSKARRAAGIGNVRSAVLTRSCPTAC